jgi:murein DD-endopeptidase MepM/ murein hydrolase activator NlpD
MCEDYYRWSPYIYCKDNPINLTDQNGLWPTKDIVKSTQGDKFGPRIMGGELKMHWGIDRCTFHQTGFDVHAAASGKVLFIGYQADGAGHYVVIDHGNGITSVYMHLLPGSIKVYENQGIENGEVFALSGNSGHSTGPHTHIEFRSSQLINAEIFGFKDKSGAFNALDIDDLQEAIDDGTLWKYIESKTKSRQLNEVTVIGDKSKVKSQSQQDKEWNEYIKQQNEAHSAFQQGRPHEGDSNYQGSFWQAYDGAKNF